MQFIERQTILKAIESAPNAEWRAIIALARFGGLRIPSEVTRMTWNDIDFGANRLTIRATKTEHHKGKGVRFCPIFPELRPYLEDLAKLAEPGLETAMTDRVFTLDSGSTNLRTGFQRILEKAGIKCWPKLFQNLRASCETELLAIYPASDPQEIAEEIANLLGNACIDNRRRGTRITSDLSRFSEGTGESGSQSGTIPTELSEIDCRELCVSILKQLDRFGMLNVSKESLVAMAASGLTKGSR